MCLNCYRILSLDPDCDSNHHSQPSSLPKCPGTVHYSFLYPTRVQFMSIQCGPPPAASETLLLILQLLVRQRHYPTRALSKLGHSSHGMEKKRAETRASAKRWRHYSWCAFAAIVLALTSVLPDAPAITFEWHDLSEPLPLETRPGPKTPGNVRSDNDKVSPPRSSWQTASEPSMRERAKHERKG